MGISLYEKTRSSCKRVSRRKDSRPAQALETECACSPTNGQLMMAFFTERYPRAVLALVFDTRSCSSGANGSLRTRFSYIRLDARWLALRLVGTQLRSHMRSVSVLFGQCTLDSTFGCLAGQASSQTVSRGVNQECSPAFWATRRLPGDELRSPQLPGDESARPCCKTTAHPLNLCTARLPRVTKSIKCGR